MGLNPAEAHCADRGRRRGVWQAMLNSVCNRLSLEKIGFHYFPATQENSHGLKVVDNVLLPSG
jgi:hypothetical protein